MTHVYTHTMENIPHCGVDKINISGLMNIKVWNMVIYIQEHNSLIIIIQKIYMYI